jgi:dTDP-4-dehydrorhamnose 3,5-epimerase
MELVESAIAGCYMIVPFHHADERGDFVKVYHEEVYSKSSLDFKIREVYYSESEPNVFRGFHFQLPPNDHAKIVYCQVGEVIDFVLDLRKESSTYGKVASFKLNQENRHGVYIPRGCAHGFYSLNQRSMLSYLLETVHAPDSDAGIAWDSVDLGITIKSPLSSKRDASFITFQDFDSPF